MPSWRDPELEERMVERRAEGEVFKSGDLVIMI
jgi:hypothetical protein